MDELLKKIEEITGFKVKVVESRKNNGVVKKGITPYEQRAVNPIAYLDGLEGMSLEEKAEVIGKQLAIHMPQFDLSELNAEYVQRNVFMCLVNTKANEELLSNIPHRNILDMSIIYRVTAYGGSFIVNNDNSFGLNENELYESAKANEKDRGYEVVHMSNFVPFCPDEVQMYIGVSGKMSYGAAMIFSDKLYNLANDLHDDLFIIPSSVHEIIIMPLSEVGDEFKMIVDGIKEINATELEPTDVLSDNAYIFSREDRRIRIA